LIASYCIDSKGI